MGSGSGILSFFAVQAGARKVYAVEASNMVEHSRTLVKQNGTFGQIVVVQAKLEEIQLPEKADVIISEPIGYMLLNERMLETFLFARKWLKPGGKMFPTQADMCIAPFTDEPLYTEQVAKADFWARSSFHGVRLEALHEAAEEEYFAQPIVRIDRFCRIRKRNFIVDITPYRLTVSMCEFSSPRLSSTRSTL